MTSTAGLEAMPHPFFVITGGPGSGKTSLIDALEAGGYARSVEAGRAVIKEQVAIGGNALPWGDRALFAELMLSWELRSYRMAEEEAGPVVFDRGVPDVLGYLRLCGLSVPAHMLKAAETFRYRREVFIAPPWREIFAEDSERKQSFAEAERTHAALSDAYNALGYELIELPRASIAERKAFVSAAIGDARMKSLSQD
jgi:predicted ATPase